jgi:hypothetical protein
MKILLDMNLSPAWVPFLETNGYISNLEGIYHWIIFLPSKVHSDRPVPNRYFGIFQDGSLKDKGVPIKSPLSREKGSP